MNQILRKTKVSLVLVLILFALIASCSQNFSPQFVQAATVTVTAPTEEWNQTYGGTGEDDAHRVVQTSDGGYALAGSSNGDFWLVKTDGSGNPQWNKTYGKPDSDDYAYCVVQTSDGGYALAGFMQTYSYGYGSGDFWLVKTDCSGNQQWNKTYGGVGDEEAWSVVQASDGGYALAGYTNSYGVRNAWLVKTDCSGNQQWNETYGGLIKSSFKSIVKTSDGGYALAGAINPPYGGRDFWLVKIDSLGNEQWNRTYGNPDEEYAEVKGIADAYCVVQTSDGGYALTGYITPYNGKQNAWLVKTDSSGNPQWNQTYAGPEALASCVVQTSDGGYALAGYTDLYYAGEYYSWLIKTDCSGNQQWNKTYREPNMDYTSSVVQTSDGGYALAVFTYDYGDGNSDAWLIKFAGTELISANPYSDPTAVAWNVDSSFSFMDMIKANHTFVPADKTANPVQKLTISYDEKPLTCNIKVGGVTYSLGKDFTYTGHVDYIYYNPTFNSPTLGFYYPSSFSGTETTVSYMYNFSAIPGGLEGTLSMHATMKDAVGSIVSVGGTGDFWNVEVKATISPQWYDAANLVINIYHDGMVSGWPHAVPAFMTSNIGVTYAQLTDYCINVWGLSSNPYPTFPANVTSEYLIFNVVIGDKFYLGVSCNSRTGIYDPVAKTVTLTYNATWYLGDSYNTVAKLDQGFKGTVVVTLLNYTPANATATPPTPTTYNVGPGVFNLQGFGALSGQTIMLRSDDAVTPIMGKGYAILP
jgi:hypothetical protein